ncbi:MAG: hypothetical protein SF069_10060 [Phycisphaerae bacterium]|nr:hypothetical protein [Phycisphaerae bacterium]
MSSSKAWLVAASGAALLIGAMAFIPRPRVDPTPLDRRVAVPRDEWTNRVRAAMAEYATWERVSDDPNMAPMGCRDLPPHGIHQSASRDDSTHGRKLYYLYAKHGAAYKSATDFSDEYRERPVIANDQILVKQSWAAIPCADSTPETDMPVSVFETRADVCPPLAREARPDILQINGEYFRAGEFQGLFMMMQVGPPGTPGTDEGWVYASVAADRQTIQEVGLIESCVECHRSAPHGRLFGLPQGMGRRVAP